jgi:hypothetical protein
MIFGLVYWDSGVDSNDGKKIFGLLCNNHQNEPNLASDKHHD